MPFSASVVPFSICSWAVELASLIELVASSPLPQPDRRPTAQIAPAAVEDDEDDEDDDLAAYNRHLARLAEQGRE